MINGCHQKGFTWMLVNSLSKPSRSDRAPEAPGTLCWLMTGGCWFMTGLLEGPSGKLATAEKPLLWIVLDEPGWWGGSISCKSKTCIRCAKVQNVNKLPFYPYPFSWERHRFPFAWAQRQPGTSLAWQPQLGLQPFLSWYRKIGGRFQVSHRCNQRLCCLTCLGLWS